MTDLPTTIYNNSAIDFSPDPVQKILNQILGIVTLILNVISAVAILQTKSIHRRQKVCFVALLITDMALGLQITVIRCIPFVYNSDHYICSIRLYSGLILNFVTVMSNVMMTAERFIMLYMPFAAESLLTWKKLACVLLAIWVTAISLTFGIFHAGFGGKPVCQFWTCGSPDAYVFTGVFICVAYVSILSMYAYIAKETKRHFRQIWTTMVVDRENTREVSTHLSKSQRRLNITVGIITTFFGISYIPMGVYSIYFGIVVKDSPESTYSNSNNRVFTTLLGLYVLNSIINPFVYIWRLTKCREEALRRLKCKSFNTESNISSMTAQNSVTLQNVH